MTRGCCPTAVTCALMVWHGLATGRRRRGERKGPGGWQAFCFEQTWSGQNGSLKLTLFFFSFFTCRFSISQRCREDPDGLSWLTEWVVAARTGQLENKHLGLLVMTGATNNCLTPTAWFWLLVMWLNLRTSSWRAESLADYEEPLLAVEEESEPLKARRFATAWRRGFQPSRFSRSLIQGVQPNELRLTYG